MQHRRYPPGAIVALTMLVLIAATAFGLRAFNGREPTATPAAPTASAVAVVATATALPPAPTASATPTVAPTVTSPTVAIAVAATPTPSPLPPTETSVPATPTEQPLEPPAEPAEATSTPEPVPMPPPPAAPPAGAPQPVEPTPTPAPAPVPVAPAPPPPAAPPAPVLEPTATPIPPPPPPPPAAAPAPPVVGGPPPRSVGLPVRLIIPAIGVDAPIEPVGVGPDGNMATPSDPWYTAWYAPGTRPGQVGNAAVAGHVDYRGIGAVVFWELNQLVPGDEVLVVTDDGLTLRFVVRGAAMFVPQTAPLVEIFGPAATPNLNLITCGGTFNPATRSYDQRLVVFTTYAGR